MARIRGNRRQVDVYACRRFPSRCSVYCPVRCQARKISTTERRLQCMIPVQSVPIDGTGQSMVSRM